MEPTSSSSTGDRSRTADVGATHARRRMPKPRRSYPAEELAAGSKFELTDPDYEDHRIQRMRSEYRSLPSEWRGAYLGGLSKKDAEAVHKQSAPTR